jgi:glutaredoxin
MLKYEIDFNKGNYVIGHFTFRECAMCEKAKSLLDKYKKQYMFIQADKRLFGKILSVTGSKKVPQIFMDGKPFLTVEELEESLKYGEKE